MIKVIKTYRNHTDINVVEVDRSDLTDRQERAYSFAEKMLNGGGTELLKIEARARLAGNGLCFDKLYHQLG